MVYEEIIRRVATDTNLPHKLVDKGYRAYWRAVREYIAALPLKQDLTDEEFLQLRPNINVPSIGKLHVTLDRYHGMKKNFEIYRKNYKGNKYKNQDNNVEN